MPFDKDRYLEALEASPAADFTSAEVEELEMVFQSTIMRKAFIALHIQATAQSRSLLSLPLYTEEGRMEAMQTQATVRGLLQAIDFLLDLPSTLRERANAGT